MWSTHTKNMHKKTSTFIFDNDNTNDFISNNNYTQKFLFTQFENKEKQEVINLNIIGQLYNISAKYLSIVSIGMHYLYIKFVSLFETDA